MDKVITALSQTPIWVSAIFIYLLIVGFNSHKLTKAHILNLALIPLLFCALMADTFMSNVGFSRMTISITVLGFLFGFGMGWLFVWHRQVVIDKKKRRLDIAGNWNNFIFTLLMFFAKYGYGYELARDPNLVTLTRLEVAMLLTMAICTGIFLGKFIHYLCWLKFDAEPSS